MGQVDARDAHDEQVQTRLHAGALGVIESLAQDFLAPEMGVVEPRDLVPRGEINRVGDLGDILQRDGPVGRAAVRRSEIAA